MVFHFDEARWQNSVTVTQISFFLPKLGITLVVIDRLKVYCPFTLIVATPDRPNTFCVCVILSG